MSKICLGIDVAKKTLDVALLFNDRTLTKQFANSPAGFKLLAAWLESTHLSAIEVCLEATGSYGEAVALFCTNKGIESPSSTRSESRVMPKPNCSGRKPTTPVLA